MRSFLGLAAQATLSNVGHVSTNIRCQVILPTGQILRYRKVGRPPFPDSPRSFGRGSIAEDTFGAGPTGSLGGKKKRLRELDMVWSRSTKVTRALVALCTRPDTEDAPHCACYFRNWALDLGAAPWKESESHETSSAHACWGCGQPGRPLRLSFTGAPVELCEALLAAVGLDKDREPQSLGPGSSQARLRGSTSSAETCPSTLCFLLG